MTKLSSKETMKRLLCICASALLVLALAACGSSNGDGGSNDHNDKISNAWIISMPPLVPDSASGIKAEVAFMPSDDYIIADGSGHITESSFYTSPTGTYSVKGDGSFSIMVNGVTYEGTLESPTSGIITSPESGFISAITNTSGCTGNQLGIGLSEGFSFVVDIDANGAVTQNGTFSSDYDVTGGHIFCWGGLALGAVTSADTGDHKKFRLNGTPGVPPPPTANGIYDTNGYHIGAAAGTFYLGPPVL